MDHRALIRCAQACLLLVAAGAVAACAGDGSAIVLDGIDDCPPPPDETTPTMSRDVAPIFAVSCAHCHNPWGQFPWLDSAENAYSTLLDVPSVYFPGMVLIEPCHPEGSYLLRKITGPPEFEPGVDFVGNKMPPISFLEPTPEQRATIAAWVEGGALP